MTEETYVYNGSEVVLTGRSAEREVGKSTRTKRVDTLYEIQPADKEEGSWKKWIRKEELYQIKE